MNTERNWRATLGTVLALAVLSACSSTPTAPGELERAREAVARVEQMPNSSNVAGAELKEAQDALRKADEAARKRESDEEVAHLAYVASQQAAVAEAKMQEAAALEQTKRAEADRNAALLQARELEAAEAERRAAVAEASADAAWRELEQARETERGVVLTLGDLLFDSGGATLKPGAELILDRLGSYLQQNPDTRAIIEGHTDNVGSHAMNQSLSERRALAVANALRVRGIDGTRFEIMAMGEAYPIATNDTSAGRQENRRVEVVLSDTQGDFRDTARRTASR
jgi:outer membrane protein OmpA-like peptidoglycan-associated protein